MCAARCDISIARFDGSYLSFFAGGEAVAQDGCMPACCLLLGRCFFGANAAAAAAAAFGGLCGRSCDFIYVTT